MTGRVSLAMLATACYFTTLEVFVRGAYGGYFAPSNFLVLMMILAVGEFAAERNRDTSAIGFIVGILAALFNHKLILLPVAIGVWQLACKKGLRRALLHPVVIGFLAGWLVYGIYGLSLAPSAFIHDHLQTHLVDRITRHNEYGYTGYLGPLSLWGELNAHSGYLLLPAGLVAMIALLWSSRRRGDSELLDPANLLDRSNDSARSRALLPVGLCAIWTIILATLFMWTDWRQTKHVTPLLLLPPLMLARFTAEHRRWLIPVLILLLSVLAIDLDLLRHAAEHFDTIPITPAW